MFEKLKVEGYLKYFLNDKWGLGKESENYVLTV